ncbi:MAG: SOS response-associated peptidase family protein [Steroidobacteraceae bacterium]
MPQLPAGGRQGLKGMVICFSAQIEESYSKYLRATGAQIDIEQFVEIFGVRVHDPSIKIPRAVDRWFEHPKGADELVLRNLLMQHRAARLAELNVELKKQWDRLSKAEAALQNKPTKKASEEQRIATAKIESLEKRRPLFEHWLPTKLDDRIFPMQYAPIVLMADGKPVIRLARYHCRQDGRPATIDREKDGLYNARRDNITRFWRNEFGKFHALMLVTSFFENVDQDGRNVVLHFTPQPAETMLIACVYSVWKDPAGGRNLLSFAAVTDDPPAEVAAAGHDRIIINLGEAAARRWLSPEGRTAAELQAILDDRQRPFYTHEVMAA